MASSSARIAAVVNVVSSPLAAGSHRLRTATFALRERLAVLVALRRTGRPASRLLLARRLRASTSSASRARSSITMSGFAAMIAALAAMTSAAGMAAFAFATAGETSLGTKYS